MPTLSVLLQIVSMKAISPKAFNESSQKLRTWKGGEKVKYYTWTLSRKLRWYRWTAFVFFIAIFHFRLLGKKVEFSNRTWVHFKRRGKNTNLFCSNNLIAFDCMELAISWTFNTPTHKRLHYHPNTRLCANSMCSLDVLIYCAVINIAVNTENTGYAPKIFEIN